MRQVKSGGVILFRDAPTCSFLLMKHTNRFDLPKGHIEKGESEVECALRELYEETGIYRELVVLEPDFRFETVYLPIRFLPADVGQKDKQRSRTALILWK